ncbi:hypothetical protein SeLEV6574_g06283 [Synchytrium endobioticum]|uniref:LysM domain-containing protein n=1 Tax=Synchytrium endobioticum TaxID=286115 RepID=A0A507CPI4_9FUNG|nr:hypothetical protein SeLEV6574_g06283 [Synchytrium endobioticum]
MDVPPLTPSAIATTEWISVTSSPLAGTDPLRLVALDPLSSNHNLHQAASQVPSSAASAPTQFSARLAAALKTEMASLDRPRPKTHQVTAHDTVESIAVKYGVSASDLKRINKIYDPSHIIVKSSVVIPSVQKRSSSGDSIHRKLRVWSASELLLRLEEDIPAISETLESMDVAATIRTSQSYRQLEPLKAMTLIDSPTCRVVFRPPLLTQTAATEITIELTPLVHLLPAHEQKRQVERVREYVRRARSACEARGQRLGLRGSIGSDWTGFWKQTPIWVGLVMVADAESAAHWPSF